MALSLCTEGSSSMGKRTLISRRKWLQRTGQVMAYTTVGPYMLTSAALGSESKTPASNRIVIGLIGAGERGMYHLKQLRSHRDDVELLAVADVYEQNRTRALSEAEKGCQAYTDYREMLARRDIDAVVIATPDHWHALMAIHACDAGKDVYCETPISLTIREARQIVKAVQSNATIFQAGSQQRSDSRVRRACELVRNDRIGKLERIVVNVGRSPVCHMEPDASPPPGLDWNLWLGPAPWSAYTPKRCLKTFRWFYDYASGTMSNPGASYHDIAQWGNGTCHTGPVKTEPVFVEFPTRGLYETATRFEVKHTYGNGVILHTTSHTGGVEFHGSDGWIKINGTNVKTSAPQLLKERIGDDEIRLDESTNHYANWIRCIKTRQQPICNAEAGCRSATLSHLTTIALRTGRTLEWDPAKEEITNDANLGRWLSRPYRAPWHI